MSDLIGRHGVVAWLDNMGYPKLADIVNDKKRFPSAEPERKIGKWMLCDNQRREDVLNDNYMYTCTNCLHSDLHSKSVVVPYCWYCGAKMGEGEKSEN